MALAVAFVVSTSYDHVNTDVDVDVDVDVDDVVLLKWRVYGASNPPLRNLMIYIDQR